jgi:hypothetical protein
MNLPYLGYAGGILPRGPEDLQTSNIEMWPLDQIYRLRSDLISLSVMIDVDEGAIQEGIESGFRGIVESLRCAEDKQPLRLRRLKFALPQSRPDFVPRPPSPLPASITHPRGRPESQGPVRGRPTSRHVSIRSNTSSRTLSAESLWESVDLFLRPIEKLSSVQRYLAAARPTNDRCLLTEPLGPHYSITLPKTPAVVSDANKSRLIIPPPPADLAGNTESSSSLHARLISAVVPLLGAGDPGSLVPSGDDGAQTVSQLLRDVRQAERCATPLAAGYSFGGYSWLSFDEKLELELGAAGIEGHGNQIAVADCPILQDLAEAFEKEGEVLAEANKWRKLVAGIIEERRAVIEERAKHHRQWIAAMNSYITQEKAKVQQVKKKQRTLHATPSESD